MINTTLEFVKVWYLNSRKNFSIISLVETCVEYSIYFVFIRSFFKNTDITLIWLFLILFTKYVYKNVLFLKQAIANSNFNYLILKPINPIHRLLVSGVNITELILGTLVVFKMLATFPQYVVLIFSVLIIIAALYIFVLCMTVNVKSMFAVEKLFMLLVLLISSVLFSTVSFSGLVNTLGQLSVLVFSVSTLFLSMKFWNSTLNKYMS